MFLGVKVKQRVSLQRHHAWLNGKKLYFSSMCVGYSFYFQYEGKNGDASILEKLLKTFFFFSSMNTKRKVNTSTMP